MRNLLLTLALSALVACGGSKTSEDYLARAKDFMEESDFAAATIELQNALKQDPTQTEARWLLGEIYFGEGDLAAAEHEYLRAQELGWPDDAILPALAKVYLAQRKYDVALALEPEGLSPEGAAALLSNQAMAALVADDPDRARELVEQAASKDPDSPDVILAKTALLLFSDDLAGALEQVEPLLQGSPGEARGWRLKAQALMRLDRLEEARDALDKSIEFSQGGFADRVARALINLQYQEYGAAQVDASDLMELAPSHPASNYVQGLLHFQNKNYLGAIETLTMAEPIADQYPLIYYYLAVSQMFEKNIEASTTFARQFVTLTPSSGTGRKLLAVTLIQTGDPKQAHTVLRPLVEGVPNDIEALNIMANALLLDRCSK